MNNENEIPDAETRAKNVGKLQEVCLRFDHLNMMLEQASAMIEADLQNSSFYVSRRERIKKQLAKYQQNLNK